MKIRTAALALLVPAMGFCFPPGSPMSEFGPSQVALGAFFDHSGQDLFEDASPSVLNTTGVSLDYAPWTFLQLGMFGGGGELDVAVPDSKADDTSAHSFNTDYSLYGGASLKLSTPRFAANTTRLVAFGAAAYLNSTDNQGNELTPIVYNTGASVQFMIRDELNLVLGGEFYAWDGTQKSARGKEGAFGLSAPTGIMDYLRGLVGVEYYFKGKNRPFISVAFRPTGSMGWHDQLGLRNASISISLGAMATLGKGHADADEDEPDIIEQ